MIMDPSWRLDLLRLFLSYVSINPSVPFIVADKACISDGVLFMLLYACAR